MATTNECPICLDNLKDPKTLGICNHSFCKTCIDETIKRGKSQCPVCRIHIGTTTGNQPPGRMKVDYTDDFSLPGYEASGTILITYQFRDGIQTEQHPNPGVPYSGTRRRAYLPNNAEGNEILSLIRKAFAAKLIFTVGLSVTTGKDNRITWNDIHHKTRVHGGPSNFGYPDPTYLKRVREELEAHGIR